MATQTKQPTKRFKFEPIIRIPSVIPYMIEGDNAPAFLDEFNRVVDLDYKGNKHLKVLTLEEVNGKSVVTGSNPLIFPVVSRLVTQPIAKPEDIQQTLIEGDSAGIQGDYHVDFGNVLDFSRNNHELALSFYHQLPK